MGETIVLPCSVDHLGSHVLLWRRDNLILTAAKLMVIRDSRFSLEHDYDLRIANITTRDAGEYVCQIADISTQDQVHKVTVLAPPVIRSSVASGQLTARKGGSVTLTCAATGNPDPTILWSKKDSGHLYKPGLSVTLDRVDRHHAGIYQCTATNGVGPPASVEIKLDVLHPPEIEVDQGWVNAAEGSQGKLICTVYGNPTPNMIWYHEGAMVVATKRYSTDTIGNRHILTIQPVHRSDFGNFSCVAENPLGRSKHTIQFTGKPGKLRIISSPYSSSTQSYNLVWQVDSASPLEECRVTYRKIMINDSHQQVGAWLETTFKPPTSAGRSSLSFLISGLDSSSVFQAKVQVRNRYGWSDLSDPHQFYTRGADHELFENNVEHLSSKCGDLGSSFHLVLAIGLLRIL
ncbi:roundabout homolog 1-like [Homalodisca vitripennis]|uniref:roundabout homolog 1-like n=1 Tax=Homalodisca vitripennis TaxID=197043 RepID=UPI001EEBAC66|nr:roundabout homolog 1-like [Homalodisca vitripennis]